MWGWACIGIPLNYSKTRLWLQGLGHRLGLGTRIGQVRPSGAEGRVGPVRAERGWGGVGHALGFNYMTPRLGPGCKESGAAE